MIHTACHTTHACYLYCHDVQFRVDMIRSAHMTMLPVQGLRRSTQWLYSDVPVQVSKMSLSSEARRHIRDEQRSSERRLIDSTYWGCQASPLTRLIVPLPATDNPTKDDDTKVLIMIKANPQQEIFETYQHSYLEIDFQSRIGHG